MFATTSEHRPRFSLDFRDLRPVEVPFNFEKVIKDLLGDEMVNEPQNENKKSSD